MSEGLSVSCDPWAFCMLYSMLGMKGRVHSNYLIIFKKYVFLSISWDWLFSFLVCWIVNAMHKAASPLKAVSELPVLQIDCWPKQNVSKSIRLPLNAYNKLSTTQKWFICDMNLWKYRTHTNKKTLLNAEAECNTKIASHHRNEKDNWITITSNLQFAISENKQGLLLLPWNRKSGNSQLQTLIIP